MPTITAKFDVVKLLLPTAAQVDRMKSQWESRMNSVAAARFGETFAKNPLNLPLAAIKMTKRYAQLIPTASLVSLQSTRYLASQGTFEPNYDAFIAQADKSRHIAKMEQKYPSRVATTLDVSTRFIKNFTSIYAGLVTDRLIFSKVHNIVKEFQRNLVEGVTPLTFKTTPTPALTLAAVAAALVLVITAELPVGGAATWVITDFPAYTQHDTSITVP